MIEGDELYTRVNKKVAPDASQGWTVVLMDRATRFIWDMHCGRKDRVAPHLTVVSQTASAISGWSFCLGGRPRRLGGTQAGRGTW